MPLNMPSTTPARISIGPARVFLGPAGATPSIDVGSIVVDDGVTVETSSETVDITQGNPALVEKVLSVAQGVMLKLSGLELDHTRMAWAMGSGTTTSGGGNDTLSWGGDPIVTELAIHVQHQMPISGNTLNIYIWKATMEAPPSFTFTKDPHKYSLSFKALRSATDWNGATLDYKSQLIRVDEET